MLGAADDTAVIGEVVAGATNVLGVAGEQPRAAALGEERQADRTAGDVGLDDASGHAAASHLLGGCENPRAFAGDAVVGLDDPAVARRRQVEIRRATLR